MQWLMKICARGALGLGAAALLLSGVPAHANPAAGAASRESQPRLLAQNTAQPEEAAKQGQQPQQEEQPQQPQGQKKKAKMRGAMPEAAREAPAEKVFDSKPAEPAAKRFGAGVIRKSEKPVDSE